MDINQVVKQLEWMDEERRRDKSIILALQDRVNTYADTLEGANQRIKGLDEEIKKLSLLVGRLNQFDGALVQQRVEIRRMMDEAEKKMARNRDDGEKILRGEIKTLAEEVAAMDNKLNQIQELRRELQVNVTERLRMEHDLNNFNLRLADFAHTIEDNARNNRVMDEARRQDAKQIDGIQGEIIALRKRIDERRSEMEGLSVNINRVENRLNEVLSLESSRKSEQQAFIEQINLNQVEYERTIKEWIKRIESFEKQGLEVQDQLQGLDATHRLVKRGQEAIDMLTDRMERRINEITELQRLNEERFRQEWTTFKGDDQKRWADYSLSQDERSNEMLRQNDKMLSRLVQLEDQFHISRDVITQLNFQTEKGLQVMMEIAHNWVETYQKIKASEK
ncbi:MAG: hypothetical protein WCI88_01190 [Chloroflexota bacterium]